MDGVFKQIDELSENSTVADFKTIIKSVVEDNKATILKKDEEIKSLNDKLLELLAATAQKKEEKALTAEEKEVSFIKGLWHNDVELIQKSGGRLVGSEWKTKDHWDMYMNAKSVEEKAALGTVLRGDSATGSYLVPTEWYNDVMGLAAQSSQMMGKVTTIPMSTRQSRIPVEATAVSLAWPSDETSAKSETNPTFGYKDLSIKTCAGWLTWTDELEEDSTINLVQYFQKLFAEAWGSEFDKQVLTASAAPFTGILHDSNVNTVTMGAGKTSFGDLGYDDLIDLQSALTKESAHVGASYIMNRKVFNYVRQLKDDNGNYIYQPAGGSVPPTIGGVPYLLSEQMPSATAASTPFVAYGNPKYVIHGARTGMEFKIYGDTVRNIDYDQIFLRFRIRQGFVVAVPAAFAVLQTAA